MTDKLMLAPFAVGPRLMVAVTAVLFSACAQPVAKAEIRQKENIAPEVDKNGGPAKFLSCKPGCRLESDDDGEPIIPVWCTEWMLPSDKICMKYKGAQHCYHGYAGTNSPYGFDVSVNIKQFLSDSYLCTKIRLDKLTEEVRDPYAQVITSGGPQLPNTPVTRCNPGCFIHESDAAAKTWCPGWLGDAFRESYFDVEQNRTVSAELPRQCGEISGRQKVDVE